MKRLNILKVGLSEGTIGLQLLLNWSVVVMPVRPDAPLRKVTLNLYEADCAKLESFIGYGWTERVRLVVHEYCEGSFDLARPVRTLGDLADD